MVQPPITVSLPAVRQSLWTSSASVVTLWSWMEFAAAALMFAGLVITDSGAFTRSKMGPRLTAKPSWRWPTNMRPVSLPLGQPGIFTSWMCLLA